MSINITPSNTYINQTATADIEDRHYDLDYQIQVTGEEEPQLSYLNATFQYGQTEGEPESGHTQKTGTLTWGQGMLQLPRAIEWDDNLWQYVKDFGDILQSVTASIVSTISTH